jgi:hypothetical protein
VPIWTNGGIVAAGFLDINVLAGLQSGKRHRGMPMVGRGNGDGVDLFQFENLAKVFFRHGRFAHFPLHALGKLLENPAVHIADMGNSG